MSLVLPREEEVEHIFPEFSSPTNPANDFWKPFTIICVMTTGSWIPIRSILQKPLMSWAFCYRSTNLKLRCCTI